MFGNVYKFDTIRTLGCSITNKSLHYEKTLRVGCIREKSYFLGYFSSNPFINFNKNLIINVF